MDEDGGLVTPPAAVVAAARHARRPGGRSAGRGTISPTSGPGGPLEIPVGAGSGGDQEGE